VSKQGKISLTVVNCTVSQMKTFDPFLQNDLAFKKCVIDHHLVIKLCQYFRKYLHLN
jgi:hypothetical protein